MKKNDLLQSKVKFTFVLICIIMYQTVFSQQHHTGDLPIPHMWLDRSESDRRIDWFEKNKMLPLSIKIGKQEAKSQFFKRADFDTMLKEFDDYNKLNPNKPILILNIYFAAFANQPKTSDPRYPLYSTSEADLLTIMFVPETADGELTDAQKNKKYYTISPTKGFVDITDLGKTWEDLYLTQLPVLDSTIDKFDPDNYMDYPNRTGFSDTKIVVYPYDYIHELREEMKYQDDIYKNGITGYLQPDPSFQVTGIKLSFAAYTDAGNPRQKGQNPKRLMLMLGLTANKGGKEIEFNIEDVPADFSNRRHTPWPNDVPFKFKAFKNFKSDFFGGGLDNGQLCPTYCPKP